MKACKNRSWMLRLLLVIALFAAAAAGGGCGGGGNVEPTQPNAAYLDGELHGELAQALAQQMDITSYDGETDTDRMLIISAADGVLDGVDAAMKAAPALEAGQVVALEHVNQDEINSFVEELGMDPLYIVYDPSDPDVTETSKDVCVELFAMERRGGHNFYYVMLNDDEPPILSPDVYEEHEYTIEGEEGSPDSKVTVTSREVSNEGPEPTPDEEVQDSRVSDFLRWASEGDARLAALQPSGNGAESAESDLKELAAADVWDYNASYDGQSFTIRYTIYSCHSFEKNKDYYLISQSAQLNPSVKWKKTEGHVKWPRIYTPKQEGHMRLYGFNNRWIFSWQGGGTNNPAKLVNTQPQNANGTTSVTSGYSWSMSGSLGFSGLSGTGSLSSGVSFSESQSFSISDCTVNNKSADDGKVGQAQWEYVLANPRNGSTHFYYTDLDDAPLLSRSNFQPVNRWIWEVERVGTADNLSFNSQFYWTNGKSEGQVNAAYIKVYSATHKDWQWRHTTVLVPIKRPPLTVIDKSELEFTKNGQTQTVTLVSANGWTAESNAEWCRVEEGNGDKTGSQGLTLHITTDTNNSGANREAKVTIKSLNDKCEIEIRVFQSMY